MEALPSSSAGKESTCNASKPGSIPGWGRAAREGIDYPLVFLGFPAGSSGKESARSVEDRLRLLGWKDPLEEGMATHSSILAGESPARLPGPWGHKELDTTKQQSTLPQV